MKNIVIIVFSLIAFSSCKQEEKQKTWQFSETITVDGVNPIGIAFMENELWLSDGDHNRLVQIDNTGRVLKTIDSMERPMHISTSKTTLYVPEYGKDSIAIFTNNERSLLQLKDSLDAPAAVSVFENEYAIADFYNNRILYSNNETEWMTFGKEGKADGEFYYPTDVQITEGSIWVADAYNNRIQMFDKKGTFMKTIGTEQKMNAATGLYISENELFVTDFENSRVLVFDLEGNLKQELKEGIDKPTDAIVHDEILHIINYRSGTVNKYVLKENESEKGIGNRE